MPVLPGVTTQNLDQAVLVDDVVGNRGGSTVRIPAGRLAEQLGVEAAAVHHPTKAALDADLGWPAGTKGAVWGDPAEALRGIHLKVGAEGEGSWSRIGDLPISSFAAAALDAKAPLASPTFTGTVAGVTKAMVGLGNADNTSDAAKPVSTAQQAALDAKAPLASPTFTGTVAGITKAMVGLGNADNTSDAAKPVSTAMQAMVDARARRSDVDAGGIAFLNLLRRVFAEFREDGTILTRWFNVSDDGSPTFAITGPGRRAILALHGDAVALGGWQFTETGIVPPPGAAVDSTVAAALAALSARIDMHLDGAGQPLLAPYRRDQLGYWHGKLIRLRGGETATAKLGLFGDSWIYRPLGSPKVARYLQSVYGNGGPGLVRLHAVPIPLNSYHVQEDGAVVTVALTGAGWSTGQIDRHSLSSGWSETAGAGDRATVSGADAAAFSACKLLFVAGGAARYRWNGGSWTGLDLSSGAVADIAAGKPVGGAWTLDIENVSGTIRLAGVTLDGTSGVIVDKPATGSTKASDWAAIFASADFRAHLAARAYDAITITLGTNDYNSYSTAVFAGHLETMIDEARDVLGGNLGIAIVMPCESERTGRLAPMDAYWAVARAVGAAKAVCVHSMQTAFGTDPAVYEATWPDDIHPDATVGGAAMAAALLAVLNP